MTTRPALSVLMLAVAVSGAGCIVGQKGLAVPPSDMIAIGRTTKTEIYQKFGVPTDVFAGPNGHVLLYNRDVDRGLGFVARFYGAPVLRMSHTHSAEESLIISVDRNGVVQRVDHSDATDLAHYSFWPFGS